MLAGCLVLAGCSPEPGADPTPAADAGVRADATPTCQPTLRVTPPRVLFERIPADAVGSQTLTLQSSGDCPVSLTGVIMSGHPAFAPFLNGRDVQRDPDALADPDRDGAPGLAPGATVSLVVKLDGGRAADADGPFEASLVVRTPGSAHPIALLGNQGPCLRITPSPLDFGAVTLGDGHTASLTLQSCGTAPVAINAITLDAAGGDFSVEPLDAPELPAMGAAGGSRSLRVTLQPRRAGTHRGTLTLESTDPAAPAHTVQLLGRALARPCPVAVISPIDEVQPAGAVFSLDGSRSTSPVGTVDTYTWRVTERPAGSAAAPMEAYFNPAQPADGGRADAPGTPEALLFADVPGRYTVELEVADNAGLSSADCGQNDQVTLLAGAPAPGGLQIQLRWATPGDPDPRDADGTDLDLVLLHPFAADPPAAPWICHAAAPAPDWGPVGPEGDPLLDVDDTNGEGPETITLPSPEATTPLEAPYRVQVRFVSGAPALGPVFATVQVRVDGALVATAEAPLALPGEVWDVGTLAWPDPELIAPAP